ITARSMRRWSGQPWADCWARADRMSPPAWTPSGLPPVANQARRTKRMNVEAFCIDELTTKTLCEHFGLERLPFPKCIPPEHAFPAGQFAAAMARLQQLLATREIGVVVGEAGTGKSTLLSLFLTQVSVSRYRIVDLATPQARPRELYRAIATALGANPSWFGADALKIIDLLTQSYLESHRPNLLIID